MYTSGASTSITRTEEYRLPAAVAAHVDVVAPTTRFPRRSVRRVSSSPQASQAGIVPSTLRAMYDIGDVQGKMDNNKQAAMGFLQQYISPADVEVC